MVAYRISDGKLAVVTKFKDEYFTAKGSKFITKDEESSGVTNVTDILRTSDSDTKSYYIYDAQIHATPAQSRPDLAGDMAGVAQLVKAVEGGQLYLLTIADWSSIYGS